MGGAGGEGGGGKLAHEPIPNGQSVMNDWADSMRFPKCYFKS